MDLTTDFKAYHERITTSLVSVTRTTSQISNQDLGFHRSSSDKFSQSLHAQTTHLLRLTNKLLKAASKDTTIKVPSLQGRDGIEDNWRNVVDVIDDLLEKADRSLDEFTGVIKRLSPTRQDGTGTPVKKPRQGQAIDQWAQNNIPKPQLLFDTKVNNFETAPWKPLLSTKPHANMPLEDSIGTGETGFKHPYAHEIQHMIYPSSVFQTLPPIPFDPPEDSQPIFVDTEEAVQEMLSELKLAKEVAIDLEHNDRNSYIGMVCLMQISTRDKDWIVDTLKPWRQHLQLLNEVFANPRVIKVLHGSTSDIIWLQRDLGLYIVGLFDTYHASNALQFPSKSLKYLLERFAHFEAQKQYQLADWRIRPLPQELIDYARSDTHFLLHIYDQVRNMLLEASTPQENLVEHVLDCSRREALQVFERPIYDAESGLNQGGWMKMIVQRTNQLTNEQLGVFRAIHAWRDKKARELDEGEQNIMSNTVLWNIAETMPTFKGGFYQRGMGKVPRYVNENIPEIIEVVKQGIAQGKEGPSVHELIEKNSGKAGYLFGRNKYFRKKPEDSNRGVGATLQMLNHSGELPNTPSATENETVPVTSDEPIVVKAAASHLFGNVEPLAPSIAGNYKIIDRALESILPLQSIVRNPFTIAEAPSVSSTPVVSTTPKPITNGVSQVKDGSEEVFIIRDGNKKRKAAEALAEDLDEASNVPGAQDDFIDISQQPDPTSQDPNLESHNKKQSKQARKAEKRAKKAAEAQERAAAQANMVPFDYANAESILHANQSAQNGSTESKKVKSKPLNPFVKALDTSTGARRNKMGKELSGKSHTFRG